jgi:hypothetical protein
LKVNLFKEGPTMEEKSRWGLRHMKCPEEKGKAQLLLEWKVQKGKKVLQSVSCDNPQLIDYSGTDCQWLCLKKISPKKK